MPRTTRPQCSPGQGARIVRHAPLLGLQFRSRDDGSGALAEMALSHQRGANGTTSNGRHELLSPLTERPDRPHDRQSCIPKACLMGEKSGFAKAEAIENE